MSGTISTIGQLRIDSENRLFCDSEMLHCGQAVHVLLLGSCGSEYSPTWIETRVELDGDDKWYLVGCFGYSLAGLFCYF